MELRGVLTIVIFVVFQSAFMVAQMASGRMIENDFVAPVKHSMRLSGSFCELRTNHFHYGIDIKSSQGGSGDPIIAIGDGTISRIRVNAGSYGNALYIDHPNGYTSVYGHLHEFNEEIAAYVKKLQYANQEFELDHYPDSGELVVSKGQQIGLMGNTGFSFGPHLHFEIRETVTEAPINPLRFGYQVLDRRKPVLKGLKVYILDPRLRVLESRKLTLKHLSNGRYISDPDTLYLPGWRAGFAVHCHDPMNHVNNKNGVYKIRLLSEDEPAYSFDFDLMSWDDAAYYNSHVDYGEKIKKRQKWHRLYQLPGNRISRYEKGLEGGVIKLFKDHPRQLRLEVEDFHGNQSLLDWVVVRDTSERTFILEDGLEILEWDQAHRFHLEAWKIVVPQEAFYQDEKLKISNQTSKGSHSVLEFGSKDVPLSKKISISCLIPDEFPGDLKSKCFIARKHPTADRWIHCGTQIKGDSLFTQSSKLGEFAVKVDTIAPSIRLLNFPKLWSPGKQLRFRISDNYDTTDGARPMKFEARLDDEWILMEHDLKSARLIHKIEKTLKPGWHNFELTVWDAMDNKKVYTRKIFQRG